ncbi:MAG: phosphoglucosamine mutase [Actinobacteria bacterium]|nr:phosphoglucosamine mutase [Actinomycetota bacterium]
MRFGTDGIRGVANSQLTPELALRIGRATARILGGEIISIGRDTRWSGPMLEASFIAGACAEGASVEVLGVVPTPAVAFRSQVTGRPAVMISASHNPFADNGIKLFAAGGTKLSDEVQRQLEAELDRLAVDGADPAAAPIGDQVGTVVSGAVDAAYLDHVVATAVGGTFAGLRVVLDCGHGASSAFAGAAFERLGAAVTVLNDAPNGRNINDGCGSTYPEGLAEAVLDTGADLGFAFDGDADRVVAVDGAGRIIDGDQLIAIAAIDLHARGALANDTVVVTVMTNLGFRIAMAERGIAVVDTAVGDRYVLEALDTGGHVLGGEQSGHVIFRDRATTGDGVLSAVAVADIVVRSGSTLADLADAAMTRLPQVLTNVRIAAPMPDVARRLAGPLADAAEALGDTGRVLVRPSGTEPVVRVMVEAADEAVAAEWAERLAADVAALDAQLDPQVDS